MPRVVPSQVVSFINSIPLQGPKDVIHMNSVGSHRLSAVLQLVDQVPDELVTMDSEAYRLLVLAKENIKDILGTWTSNRNAGDPALNRESAYLQQSAGPNPRRAREVRRRVPRTGHLRTQIHCRLRPSNHPKKRHRRGHQSPRERRVEGRDSHFGLRVLLSSGLSNSASPRTSRPLSQLSPQAENSRGNPTQTSKSGTSTSSPK